MIPSNRSIRPIVTNCFIRPHVGRLLHQGEQVVCSLPKPGPLLSFTLRQLLDRLAAVVSPARRPPKLIMNPRILLRRGADVVTVLDGRVHRLVVPGSTWQ